MSHNGGDPFSDPQLNRPKLFWHFKPIFQRDFEFIDVQDAMFHRVLNKDDCDWILSVETEADRLDRLFFLLSYQENKSLKKFVDAIQEDYPWLSAQMVEYVQDPRHREPDNYDVCIDWSRLPRKTVDSVYRWDLLWKVIQELKGLSRKHYLIIRGNVGSGKSWLTTDACRDRDVITAMNHQIFCLNMAGCVEPEDILREMQRLEIMLRDEDHQYSYDTVDMLITEMQAYLQLCFKEKYKNALLVLLNVQHQSVLEAFNLHCKVLATGRDDSCFDKIPPRRKRSIVLDHGLTPQQTRIFFGKLAQHGLSVTEKRLELFTEIGDLCNGEPMTLSLIYNNLSRMHDKDLDEKLRRYKRELRGNSLDNQRCAAVDETLSMLPEEERRLYGELVVFPANVCVPISAVAGFWSLTLADTREFVFRLERLSLLKVDKSSGKDGMECVSMHYVYGSHLRRSFNAEQLLSMHRRLCQSYKIDTILDTRTEPELDLPDDGYVHFYIGYHLKNGGMQSLFPKLYLDFGFLEQKLRFTGLSNTRRDLEDYRDLILAKDSRGTRERLLDTLPHFLSNTEEMVHNIRDTSLLQYALNAPSKAISAEAHRQVAEFPNRVWLDDVGMINKQRRQMTNLRGYPEVLLFYGPETVLAALEDHSIVLKDLSPSYEVETVKLSEHRAPVQKMAIFEGHYLISLDADGTLLVWSLKETPIHDGRCRECYTSMMSPLDSPQSEEPRFPSSADCQKKKHEILPKYRLQEVDSFLVKKIFEYDNQKSIRMFCGMKDGSVAYFDWRQQEEDFVELNLGINLQDTKALLYIEPNYLMVLSRMYMQFYNLTNASVMFKNAAWTQYDDPLALHEVTWNNRRNLYVVFRQKIVLLENVKFADMVVTIGDLRIVYEMEGRMGILSTCLADDGQYLVLGTTRGVFVFDCALNKEVKGFNHGNSISCVDICPTDDPWCRYLIVSGTKKLDVVNIYALPGRSALARTRSLEYSGHSPQFLYSEVIPGEVYEGDFIYTVDLDNKVRKQQSHKGSMKPLDYKELDCGKISCTGQREGAFLFGTQDGKVFEWREDATITNGTIVGPLVELGEPILRIKEVDKGYCVVFTRKQFVVLGNRNETPFLQQGRLVNCFPLDQVGRILMVRSSVAAQVVDMRRECGVKGYILVQTNWYQENVACDYKAGVLAVLDTLGRIRFFEEDRAKSEEEFDLVPKEKSIILGGVATIALSQDASLLALGFQKGDIQIFRMSDLEKIKTLSSHKAKIQELRFSPWTEENSPVVLVSLAEQMCFWNIKHVVNNPLDGGLGGGRTKGLRRSSRFSRENRQFLNGGIVATEENGKLATNHNGHSNGNGTVSLHVPNGGSNSPPQEQYWEGKTGPSDKAELLACIKFVGNEAKKLTINESFDKFTTIDNEGDIYALVPRRDVEPALDNEISHYLSERMRTVDLTNSCSRIS